MDGLVDRLLWRYTLREKSAPSERNTQSCGHWGEGWDFRLQKPARASWEDPQLDELENKMKGKCGDAYI